MRGPRGTGIAGHAAFRKPETALRDLARYGYTLDAPQQKRRNAIHYALADHSYNWVIDRLGEIRKLGYEPNLIVLSDVRAVTKGGGINRKKKRVAILRRATRGRSVLAGGATHEEYDRIIRQLRADGYRPGDAATLLEHGNNRRNSLNYFQDALDTLLLFQNEAPIPSQDHINFIGQLEDDFSEATELAQQMELEDTQEEEPDLEATQPYEEDLPPGYEGVAGERGELPNYQEATRRNGRAIDEVIHEIRAAGYRPGDSNSILESRRDLEWFNNHLFALDFAERNGDLNPSELDFSRALHRDLNIVERVNDVAETLAQTDLIAQHAPRHGRQGHLAGLRDVEAEFEPPPRYQPPAALKTVGNHYLPGLEEFARHARLTSIIDDTGYENTLVDLHDLLRRNPFADQMQAARTINEDIQWLKRRYEPPAYPFSAPAYVPVGGSREEAIRQLGVAGYLPGLTEYSPEGYRLPNRRRLTKLSHTPEEERIKNLRSAIRRHGIDEILSYFQEIANDQAHGHDDFYATLREDLSYLAQPDVRTIGLVAEDKEHLRNVLAAAPNPRPKPPRLDHLSSARFLIERDSAERRKSPEQKAQEKFNRKVKDIIYGLDSDEDEKFELAKLFAEFGFDKTIAAIMERIEKDDVSRGIKNERVENLAKDVNYLYAHKNDYGLSKGEVHRIDVGEEETEEAPVASSSRSGRQQRGRGIKKLRVYVLKKRMSGRGTQLTAAELAVHPPGYEAALAKRAYDAAHPITNGPTQKVLDSIAEVADLHKEYADLLKEVPYLPPGWHVLSQEQFDNLGATNVDGRKETLEKLKDLVDSGQFQHLTYENYQDLALLKGYPEEHIPVEDRGPPGVKGFQRPDYFDEENWDKLSESTKKDVYNSLLKGDSYPIALEKAQADYQHNTMEFRKFLKKIADDNPTNIAAQIQTVAPLIAPTLESFVKGALNALSFGANLGDFVISKLPPLYAGLSSPELDKIGDIIGQIAEQATNVDPENFVPSLAKIVGKVAAKELVKQVVAQVPALQKLAGSGVRRKIRSKGTRRHQIPHQLETEFKVM